LTVSMNDVPWDRIVHFYGRATDVPTAIVDLANDRHEQAENTLLHNLEHQDGVIQATPVAVTFILEALREGRVRNRDAVNSLLARILEAARFQVECHTRSGAIPTIESIIAPGNWWPELESEEEDEALWDEWSPSEDELSGWASLTEALISGEGIGERVLPGVSRGSSPATHQPGRRPWWKFW
jgi:hypothetical protein